MGLRVTGRSLSALRKRRPWEAQGPLCVRSNVSLALRGQSRGIDWGHFWIMTRDFDEDPGREVSRNLRPWRQEGLESHLSPKALLHLL